MKHGYINQGLSTTELMLLIDVFKSHDVLIENMTINQTFDEFCSSRTAGDTIVVESYTNIFGSLTELLTRVKEFLSQGITIESISEHIVFSEQLIAVTEVFQGLDVKLRSQTTRKGLVKARKNGVKLGRPIGTTTAGNKVKEVNRLIASTNISVAKACAIVGCLPRTYYRHLEKRNQ